MIAHTHRLFVDQDSSVLFHKESSSGYTIYADLIFRTEQFRDFQITIIQEALAQIADVLDTDQFLFDDVMQTVEEILQNTNEQLISFAEKMTSVPYFDIRGILTIMHHAAFVSAVIGEVSMILVRKSHISYTMQNDSDTRQKITLFSDIIEGDMQRGDSIYLFGTHIADLMDRDDMNALITQSRGDHEVLLHLWEDELHKHIQWEDMWLITQYTADATAHSRASRSSFLPFSFPTPAWVSSLAHGTSSVLDQTRQRFLQKVHHKQFILLATGIGVFLLFVVRSIVHARIRNTSTEMINPDGTVTAALSIDDVKKEIAAFQKLDPTSEEKTIKYSTILKELQRMQHEGKWVSDVQQLKKIIDTEYLQWFNIVVLDSLQDYMVYDFSSLEKTSLGTPRQVFFHKWLFVAGEKGWLLAAISNDIRGTLVRSLNDDLFQTCSMNLLKNGLYCATSKDILLHVAKSWTEFMGGEWIVFPWSVLGLATFGSANFYVLTNDSVYTQQKTHIIRYTNVLWSQNTFWSTVPLPLGPSADADHADDAFISFAIDGTFLVWEKTQKELLQFFRNPQDKTLTSRVVPLKGWTALGKWFSDTIKVMTTPGTRYVYLYDSENKTLNVYLSAPAKNNDVFATTFELDYVMRLDFSRMAHAPYDVIVDESDGKQTAFALIDEWVAKIPMSDLLDTLKKTKIQ